MYSWFEELPEQCPPKESNPPEGKFFRLIHGEIPASEDFFSKRFENPEMEFPNIPECIARAVSTFDDVKECLKLKKLPRHKNKFVAELSLTPADGLVLKTFSKNHYSWWRSDDFIPEDVTVLK